MADPTPAEPEQPTTRPKECWLVGGGMSILAAAVHLIQEANIPGTHIHIAELHPHSGHEDTNYGDATNGYTIHAGLQPSFYEPCTQHFLSLVPHPAEPGKTLLDVVEAKRKEMLSGMQQTEAGAGAWTRLVAQTDSGPGRVDAKKMNLRLKDRLDLLSFMLQSEESLGERSIRQCFDFQFFDSTFWVLWSTSFAIQPQHSAVEFQRHLSKYLDKLEQLSGPQVMGHMQYMFRDLLITPTIEYLKKRGVSFAMYRDAEILFTDSPDPGARPAASQINLITDREDLVTISIDPNDIVIASLGPASSPSALGSHTKSVAHELYVADPEIGDSWALWDHLVAESRQHPRQLPQLHFGNPSNFKSRFSEAKLVTFTITLRSPAFIDLYTRLTGNEPGAGAFTTIADCAWHLTINVPKQPVFPDQPKDVQVVWGYGMTPERNGEFIAKPMYECSGEEILLELVAHLGFPTHPIVSTSTVIPCIMPYATSGMLTRGPGDRPPVVNGVSNLAVVGQFVDIPGDTSFSMDYNIHGAQIAVYELCALEREPAAPTRSFFMKTFDLLK
ncbi:uncharacterized protein DSM5745_00702 [Aspergillus mulundensis]|uniref:67 kDa myosin-cross-reactive antigen family protein n=1 Tax=Aspergillus mulundensis TaxID=1810919 RepID=A0A3D8T4C0_9EURO|nr:hypothetical protein DSM5745_00702 [Aspergillus mulundensis]RDW93380.1 hypothetical protein DSM5745_00702 [Aspergillus mulundensis]